MTTTRTPAEVAALQAALAGHHAAIYGYGVIGAQLSGRDRRAALAADAGHRARRDQLRTLLLARKTTPIAAAPAYRLPRSIRTPTSARVLAVTLEERIAAVWVAAVGDLRGDLRVLAARAVQEAAVRAAGWRGSSVALPGLDPSEHP